MRIQVLILCLALIGGAIAPRPAAANLTILDPIITFAEGERNKAMRVQNSSSSPIQVRVSLVNLRRMPDNTYAPATDPQPGERFADKMVRFSPSQFTLAPGAQQAIRLLAQVPADAPPGEYRTFLRVEEIGLGQVPGAAPGQFAIGLGLIHQMPVTIIRK